MDAKTYNEMTEVSVNKQFGETKNALFPVMPGRYSI